MRGIHVLQEVGQAARSQCHMFIIAGEDADVFAFCGLVSMTTSSSTKAMR
jgi:hypothetical protein